MSKNMETTDSRTLGFLEAESQRLNAVQASEDKVEVQINLGPAFLDWLSEYLDFLLFQAAEKAHPLNIDLPLLERYVVTLIDSRVKWVRRDQSRVLHWGDQIAVPTLVHLVLSSIGRVHDDKQDITYVPVFEPTVELLTRSEMEAITRRLNPLRHLGVEFAYGFKREHEGVMDFMSMQYLQNHFGRNGVFANTLEPHKAYAALAYIFGLQQLQNLVGPYRIIYGDEGTLHARIFELIRVEQRVA